jgi:hypothetical protein
LQSERLVRGSANWRANLKYGLIHLWIG